MRKEYVSFPWLFNLYIDGGDKRINGRGFREGCWNNRNGRVWNVPFFLYTDDLVLCMNQKKIWGTGRGIWQVV